MMLGVKSRKDRRRTRGLPALSLASLAVFGACAERSYYMGELAPLPGIGVAAPFAGRHGDNLLIAGGANFPDGRPWDGAPKRYARSILTLHFAAKGKAWRELTTPLPRPSAYGVSLPGKRGVFCAGGTDGKQCFAQCFELVLAGPADSLNTTTEASFEALPPLPEARAFACGARIGSRCCVFGGIAKPESTQASKALFSIDLEAPQPSWTREAELPADGRILASAGVRDGKLYIVGGCALSAGGPDGAAQRRYLADAWCFAQGAWTRLPDLPAPRAGAPSPMLSAHGQLLLMGGDPGGLGGTKPKDRHPGFATEVWGLAKDSKAWIEWPTLPKYRGPSPTKHPELGQMPPVTAPTASIGKFHCIVSGEIRPGVRRRRIDIFVASDEDSGRAILAFCVLLGLAVLPTIALVIYAFRLHARRQNAHESS